MIWLIYVADRILDSYQTEEGPGEALRHRFYRAHRMAFLPAFLVTFLVTGWMAFADLGFKTWRDGLLLATVVGGYFAVVHILGGRAQKWFPKEIAVAILFGIGTFMPVGVRLQEFHLRFLLPFVLFLLVLWMNTLIIEYSEWVALRRRDADRPHESTILVGRHLVAFGIAVGVLALCAMAGRSVPFGPADSASRGSERAGARDARLAVAKNFVLRRENHRGCSAIDAAAAIPSSKIDFPVRPS